MLLYGVYAEGAVRSCLLCSVANRCTVFCDDFLADPGVGSVGRLFVSGLLRQQLSARNDASSDEASGNHHRQESRERIGFFDHRHAPPTSRAGVCGCMGVASERMNPTDRTDPTDVTRPPITQFALKALIRSSGEPVVKFYRQVDGESSISSERASSHGTSPWRARRSPSRSRSPRGARRRRR